MIRTLRQRQQNDFYPIHPAQGLLFVKCRIRGIAWLLSTFYAELIKVPIDYRQKGHFGTE